VTESTDKPGPGRAERLRGMLRDAGRRGRHELTRPGGPGDNSYGAFRRWCQRVWRSRGGGLYAVGFMISFIYFETIDILFDDVPKVFATNWVSAEAFDFAIEFFIDTFKNMLAAFLWPVFVIRWQAPIGIFVLAAMFYLFPRLVQKPVEHWIFEGKPAPDLSADKRERKVRKAQKKTDRKAAKNAARAQSKSRRD